MVNFTVWLNISIYLYILGWIRFPFLKLLNMEEYFANGQLVTFTNPSLIEQIIIWCEFSWAKAHFMTWRVYYCCMCRDWDAKAMIWKTSSLWPSNAQYFKYPAMTIQNQPAFENDANSSCVLAGMEEKSWALIKTRTSVSQTVGSKEVIMAFCAWPQHPVPALMARSPPEKLLGKVTTKATEPSPLIPWWLLLLVILEQMVNHLDGEDWSPAPVIIAQRRYSLGRGRRAMLGTMLVHLQAQREVVQEPKWDPGPQFMCWATVNCQRTKCSDSSFAKFSVAQNAALLDINQKWNEWVKVS